METLTGFTLAFVGDSLQHVHATCSHSNFDTENRAGRRRSRASRSVVLTFEPE